MFEADHALHVPRTRFREFLNREKVAEALAAKLVSTDDAREIRVLMRILHLVERNPQAR